MASELRLRNPDGSEIVFDGWTDRPLWSSCYIRSGATDPEFKLFNYALNRDKVTVSASNILLASAPLALRKHTNVEIPGQMHTTGQIRAYRIRVELFEGSTDLSNPNDLSTFTLTPTAASPSAPRPSARRLAALHEALTMVLRVTGRDQHSAPLGYYPTGFGPVGGSAVDPGGNNSSATIEASKWIMGGVLIGGQQPYNVTLVNNGSLANGGPLNSGVSESPGSSDTNVVHFVRVYLDGLQAVPVS